MTCKVPLVGICRKESFRSKNQALYRVYKVYILYNDQAHSGLIQIETECYRHFCEAECRG